MQAPVTEPPALMRQGPQPLPQFRVIRSADPLPPLPPHPADRAAPPPLAHVERRTQVSDSFSLGSGRHHFFASRSFSAASSSMASARSFFSLAFSLSSPFSQIG